MKKVITIFLSIVLLGMLAVSMLAGCTYHVPKNHCIVGLSSGLELLDDKGKPCKMIDKEIKGVEMNWNLCYYSVVKGAEYTISCSHAMYGFIDGSGLGMGIDGDYWAAAFWQGYLFRSITIIYGENSDLQDEVIYTSNFKDKSAKIKVTFSENCTVKSDYQEFLCVGGIFEVVKKSSNAPMSNIDDYLNADGSVKERDGIYYLLLKDEVCVHQDAWITNLEVIDYSYQRLKDSGSAIQAQFTANPPVVSENEELFLHAICRTNVGEYFVYSTVVTTEQEFTMRVREHELKLTFDK